MLNARSTIRFGTRSLLIMLGVCAILSAASAWYYRKIIEPGRQSDAVVEHLESLVTRRPNDMSARQWESAVAWTLNLHHNSLIEFQVDGPTIHRFEQRLRQRLEGRVNIHTIHWIWDQYADICPGGERYQRFRPVMVEEIEHGGADWGLSVP